MVKRSRYDSGYSDTEITLLRGVTPPSESSNALTQQRVTATLLGSFPFES